MASALWLASAPLVCSGGETRLCLFPSLGLLSRVSVPLRERAQRIILANDSKAARQVAVLIIRAALHIIISVLPHLGPYRMYQNGNYDTFAVGGFARALSGGLFLLFPCSLPSGLAASPPVTGSDFTRSGRKASKPQNANR